MVYKFIYVLLILISLFLFKIVLANPFVRLITPVDPNTLYVSLMAENNDSPLKGETSFKIQTDDRTNIIGIYLDQRIIKLMLRNHQMVITTKLILPNGRKVRLSQRTKKLRSRWMQYDNNLVSGDLTLQFKSKREAKFYVPGVYSNSSTINILVIP